MVLAASITMAAPGQSQELPVDTLAMKAHTRFLSHDMLRGRATGSDGARLAALYIESRCRAMGLAPVGGGYRQDVPLEEGRVLPETRLRASRGQGVAEFRFPDDFAPNVGTKETLRDFGGRVVFVGADETIVSPALDGVALEGRVAVTLGPIRGAAVDTLAHRGTAGMIHLIGDPDAYELYARSRGDTRLYHADPGVRSSFFPPLPAVLAGPRLSHMLLRYASLGPADEIPPQALGWSIDVTIALEQRPVDAHNVLCLLPGSDARLRDTAVAFMAHYDHLGVGAPSSTGDSIYNGFSDNAAGVAMLLAIAQRLVHRPLRHSTLFLFPTGEERGLLGSDHLVAHAPWPLERIAAVINLDAGAPAAAPARWQLAGVDSTGLGALAAAVAAENGWDITTSAPRPNSDYFPFTRRGIPGLLIIPGPLPYEGLSSDSSSALFRRWDHYHQQADEWAEDFPYAGLARYAEFAYLIARRVDAAP
jgi:hypothetical protein